MNLRRKLYKFFWNHPECCINLRTKSFLKNRINEKDPNKKPFIEDFEENCKAALSDEEWKDKALVAKLKIDCVKCFLLYEITPDEYFMHDFRHKSDEYRRSILSRWRKTHICWYGMGKDARKYSSQLNDKWVFYTMAKDFFKREVHKVSKENYEELVDFCEKHPRFVAKPRNSSCGIGVQIVDASKIGGGQKRL